MGSIAEATEGNEPLDDMPAVDKKDVSRILVVVCGSNEFPHDGAAWEWRGVHEWDVREPLPNFKYKEQILLV